MIHKLIAQIAAVPDSVFGKVIAPAGVDDFDTAAKANGASLGLVLFVSNLIRVATIGAGIFVFFNIISAGLMFISAGGDSSVPDKAKDKILHSVVGLALIVFSYVVIALISFILFKDPTYILNPKITGPAGATLPIQ
ncbi:hypothetical protein BH10PAT2_BH10PAT2_0170 [soil metagenome]